MDACNKLQGAKIGEYRTKGDTIDDQRAMGRRTETTEKYQRVNIKEQ